MLWYRGLQLFQPVKPPFWLIGFRTLIRQSKGLYSTDLLFSFCALRTSGVFWQCLASSTVVFWQQFCHLAQLHSLFLTVDVDKFFSRHWFSHTVIEQSAFYHASWWLMKFSPLFVKQVVLRKASCNSTCYSLM